MNIITWLWIEDDSGPYDRERAPEAWKRLFQEDYPIFGRDNMIADQGDSQIYATKTGRVLRVRYDGFSIGVLVALGESYDGWEDITEATISIKTLLGTRLWKAKPKDQMRED